MNHLNSILIEGEMVTQPDLKNTNAGMTICTFTLESNRFSKTATGCEKEQTSIDIQAQGILGEMCANVGRKGKRVRIVGRISQDCLKNKNGEAQFLPRIYITTEHIEFRPQKQKKENPNGSDNN